MYNFAGLRIAKTVTDNGAATITEYVCGDNGLTAAIMDAQLVVVLYDAEGESVGFSVDGTAYTYVKNLQGDVLRVLDGTGTAVISYTYDPWGVPTVSGDTDLAALNPCSYRGYYYDQETGYYYLQSRYYDPSIGRFLSQDIVMEQYNILSMNLFQYCWNNPFCNADDSGNWPSARYTKTSSYFSLVITVPWSDIGKYFSAMSYVYNVIGLIACFIPDPVISKAIGVLAGIKGTAYSIISSVISTKKQGKSIHIGFSFNYKIITNTKYVYIINTKWFKLGYWYTWKTANISNVRWWVYI